MDGADDEGRRRFDRRDSAICSIGTRPVDGPTKASGSTKRVLTVALPESYANALTLEAQRFNYTVSSWTADEALAMEAQDDPGIALLVLNCDVANSEAILLALVDRCRFARIVGITNRPSFVHVATVIRSGASAVLARPATFGQIVAALDSNPPVGHVERRHMSLDRVIWEFISQAVLEAGSISEAARRLQLDRTSLKRMLRKVPPLK